MRAQVTSFLAGLHSPERVYQRWQGPYMVCAAWFGLILAAINPPHGTGITVCWIKLYTGIDCLGCGLTRSMSCGLRGMFKESFGYHPFGLFILALFLFTAITSLLPGARRRVQLWMEEHPVLLNGSYLVFVVSFVTFGTVRAALEFVHLCGAL